MSVLKTIFTAVGKALALKPDPVFVAECFIQNCVQKRRHQFYLDPNPIMLEKALSFPDDVLNVRMAELNGLFQDRTLLEKMEQGKYSASMLFHRSKEWYCVNFLMALKDIQPKRGGEAFLLPSSLRPFVEGLYKYGYMHTPHARPAMALQRV